VSNEKYRSGPILASDYGFGQKIYSVEGPLAAPQPVFAGQIRRPVFSIGPVFLLLKSWTVANGEVLQGKRSITHWHLNVVIVCHRACRLRQVADR